MAKFNIQSNFYSRYVTRLLKFIGTELETSPHVHFYSIWCHILVKIHGLTIKRTSKDVMPVLNLLQKNLMIKSKGLTDVCEKNRHTLQFLLTLAELRKERASKEAQLTELSDGEESSEDVPENIEDMQLESKWTDDSE